MDHILFAVTAVQIFNFISDCLLCVIFWQLGRDKQNESETEKNEYPEIEVVTFDEHAELQARIWNQFMKQSLVTSTFVETDRETNLVASVHHGRTIS